MHKIVGAITSSTQVVDKLASAFAVVSILNE